MRSAILSFLPSGLVHMLQRWRMLRQIRRERGLVVSKPHGLPGELIVSLTSFPARFRDLHLTLKSLIAQEMKFDRLILWIAEEDAPLLPRSVFALSDVEVRLVPDVRSYKKLVFAIAVFPEAYIVTADDDVFYPPEWLTSLVGGSEPGVITCHRAHRITSGADGRIAPYMEWQKDVQDDAARTPSVDLLPTGIGGVLYPPRSLHPDFGDREGFSSFAPDADDLWFYWMARRAGSLYKKVGTKFHQRSWPGSQQVALFSVNAVENDHKLANLMERYGSPLL